MIDETTAGPAASSASHCAAKSGGVASPAFSGTGGPKRPRNSRTFASCAASRFGGGSGIHKLSCTAPLEDERNSCIHAAIAVGDISSAPAAPMPPALATAIASEAGLAPAIGASRIGTRSPKRLQNSAARNNGEVIGLMALRFESQRERARLVAALKRPSFIRALRVKQRAAWTPAGGPDRILTCDLWFRKPIGKGTRWSSVLPKQANPRGEIRGSVHPSYLEFIGVPV